WIILCLKVPETRKQPVELPGP
ncbi:MAG: hypothetical protein H6Q29_1047, partial [Bacteroidetes bacterium]|nr:hypothetical protein [Bacteroidota bacterium]